MGIDDEDLPHGWMALARQVLLWFLVERNAISRAWGNDSAGEVHGRMMRSFNPHHPVRSYM